MIPFDVARFDPQKDSKPRWQTYEVEPRPHLSVLDGLRQIQERHDGCLAFRSSCARGMCGSCAMKINGRIRLACETRVAVLRRRAVRVEPLPNLPILKDLVVDMAPFWRKIERIRPWLSPPVEYREAGHLQSPADRERMESYVRCVFCGACEAVCPVGRRTPSFLGPAALAKAYRFICDSRESDVEDRLQGLNRQEGVWGCDTTFRCVRACPKGVPPTYAITAIRRKLVAQGVRNLCRRVVRQGAEE